MTPFFVYLIKSSVSLALLYSLFRLAMRNDRMHTLNRFLVLGILLFSAVIPFLNFQFFTKEVPVQQVEKIRQFISSPVFTPETAVAENVPVEQAGTFSVNPYLVLYAGIILVLLARLLVAVIRVLQLIKNAQKQKFSNIVLAVVKEMIQPFTFINKVVLSEKDFNENKDMIVAHEHAHIKQLHAIDLVVCELFTLLHFFNPFMWLLRRDLKLIHEYQADQAVLNKGIDAQKYQLLVLKKAVGERRFALANSFTQKPILKRFKMMKKRKKPWTGVKLLFFVPVLLLLLQAFARPEIIVEKVNNLVPMTIQQDSSEIWMKNWLNIILKNGTTGQNPFISSKTVSGKVVVVMEIRNSLGFRIDSENKLSIGSKMLIEKNDVQKFALQFLKGKHPKNKLGPEYVSKKINLLGHVKVSKGGIYLFHDKSASSELINSTIQGVLKAYLELRKENSTKFFNQDYFSLSAEKKKAINELVPIYFSVSETSHS